MLQPPLLSSSFIILITTFVKFVQAFVTYIINHLSIINYQHTSYVISSFPFFVLDTSIVFYLFSSEPSGFFKKFLLPVKESVSRLTLLPLLYCLRPYQLPFPFRTFFSPSWFFCLFSFVSLCGRVASSVCLGVL